MTKSLCLTYLLWLVGGWVCPLHHFYLRRDRQFFIWYATFGGCFGLGWFRDSWRIPEYVADANEDYDYMKLLTAKMKYGAPSFSIARFLGKVIVGMLFATLTTAIFPEELIGLDKVVYVVPYAIAMGVSIVGNIGREKTSFFVACVAAYCGLPWMLSDPTRIGTSVLFSCVAVEYKGKGWKRTYKRTHWCRRVLALVFCCGLYSALWCSAIYHNAYVHNKDGEKVKLKDAVENFFNSPAWMETKESLRHLYEYYQTYGWEKLWEEVAAQLDPEGEDHAYKVLDVTSSATEEEIHKAYRKLVKQWHPDKVKDPAMKEEAAEKFMKIQKAYETLSSIKSRRSQKNAQHRGRT